MSKRKATTEVGRDDDDDNSSSTLFSSNKNKKRRNKSVERKETKTTRAQQTAISNNKQKPVSPQTWTVLSPHVLAKICSHNKSCQAHARFAKVCKAFNYAAKKPQSWNGNFSFFFDGTQYMQSGDIVKDGYLKRMKELNLEVRQDPIRFKIYGDGSFNEKKMNLTYENIKQVRKHLSSVRATEIDMDIANTDRHADAIEMMNSCLETLNFQFLTHLKLSGKILPFRRLAEQIQNKQCKKFVALSIDDVKISDSSENENENKNALQYHRQSRQFVYDKLAPSLRELFLSIGSETNNIPITDFLGQEQPPKTLPNLTDITLHNVKFVKGKEAGLILLSSSKQLDYAIFINCHFDRTNANIFTALTQLRVLEIIYTYNMHGQLPQSEMNVYGDILAKCTSKRISMNFGPHGTLPLVALTDTFTDAMSVNRTVKELIISNVALPSNLTEFRRMHSLESLTMINILGFTIDEIKFPPNLTELTWESNEEDSPASMKKIVLALSTCPKLTKLVLKNCTLPIRPHQGETQITAEDLKVFGELKELKAMDISISKTEGTFGDNEMGDADYIAFSPMLNKFILANFKPEDSDPEGDEEAANIYLSSARFSRCPITHLTLKHIPLTVIQRRLVDNYEEKGPNKNFLFPLKTLEIIWEKWDVQDPYGIGIEELTEYMEDFKTNYTILQVLNIKYEERHEQEVCVMLKSIPPSIRTIRLTDTTTRRRHEEGNINIANVLVNTMIAPNLRKLSFKRKYVKPKTALQQRTDREDRKIYYQEMSQALKERYPKLNPLKLSLI